MEAKASVLEHLDNRDAYRQLRTTADNWVKFNTVEFGGIYNLPSLTSVYEDGLITQLYIIYKCTGIQGIHRFYTPNCTDKQLREWLNQAFAVRRNRRGGREKETEGSKAFNKYLSLNYGVKTAVSGSIYMYGENRTIRFSTHAHTSYNPDWTYGKPDEDYTIL
jgi:hypothetical protein